MICRHKLYHFTVANTRFKTKTKFATIKWYNLCRQIIQSQTCYPLNIDWEQTCLVKRIITVLGFGNNCDWYLAVESNYVILLWSLERWSLWETCNSYWTISDDKKELATDPESPSSRRQSLSVSEQEKVWRALAYDYEARFCGHCNTTTDIKEANYFGR